MELRKTRMFEPDYRHVVEAAYNRPAARLPLYEHGIDPLVMEKILGVKFYHLWTGTLAGKRAYHRQFNRFHLAMGYDVVPFERGLCSLVQGGRGLTGAQPGIVRDRAEFERYPWDRGVERYFAQWDDDFSLMAEEMPPGMKAIGGVGNGIFEMAQDLAGYEGLCMMRADDPELYAQLFRAVGDMSVAVWRQFLERYGSVFAVFRFGDDLGYKASTMLAPADIRTHIVPQYRRIVELVHAYGGPFLLHSCGNIFAVMEDMISTVGIDAKHSNEDEIAPFTDWVERYGARIGNFGGIDMDQLCRLTPGEVERSVREIIERVEGRGGIAISSGNSIPDYVPVENYLAMVRAVRAHRGEKGGFPA
jgi:uroporphyrinogen decarboxylase